MTRSRARAIGGMIVLSFGVAQSTAVAGTGGSRARDDASIARVTCVPTAATSCPSTTSFVPGSTARVEGRALAGSSALVFRGKRGGADDVETAARHVRAGHFEATVPAGARSGPVDVVTRVGRSATIRHVRVRSILADPDAFFADGVVKPVIAFEVRAPATVNVRVVSLDDGALVAQFPVQATAGLNEASWNGRTDSGPAASGTYRLEVGGDGPALPAATPPFTYLDHIFPIRGAHDLGQTATNNFGGGRGHRGQDMTADCGTPIAVARGGRVRFAGFNSAAGNYAVIRSRRTKLDYVYMHMRKPAEVVKGERVSTGQALGEIGDTGRASGCHLHFELWSRPGWYSGGSPFDPLPLLTAWAGWS